MKDHTRMYSLADIHMPAGRERVCRPLVTRSSVKMPTRSILVRLKSLLTAKEFSFHKVGGDTQIII